MEVNYLCLPHFRFAGIVSSSLKNQYVLFVKLLRISGFVLSVALLAVGGNQIFSPSDVFPFRKKNILNKVISPSCNRYKGGHAIIHWKETQHCYSLELETQRVWDYVGDNYVHRLIQSKTDGKLVELNAHCVHTNDGCGNCECKDSGLSEALLNSKVEAV